LGAYRTYQVPIASIETLTGLDFAAITVADRLPARTAGVRRDGLVRAGWVVLDAAEAITL